MIVGVLIERLDENVDFVVGWEGKERLTMYGLKDGVLQGPRRCSRYLSANSNLRRIVRPIFFGTFLASSWEIKRDAYISNVSNVSVLGLGL